jgi:acyl-coenzyme A thioesterase PaaI-like protein
MGYGPNMGRLVSETLRDTLLVRLFGLWKVPLIGYARPSVRYVDDERVEILIPLRRRTKNHLGSMYFGALMIGADLAAGYYAARCVHQSGEKIDFVFKASNARFLKRPTDDVVFICKQGAAIRDLVQRAKATGQRVDTELQVLATVPSEGPEPVAEMDLTLSLKLRKR